MEITMGKLIQCSGILAKNPYFFKNTKTGVYSIEEVCYYVKNNIYIMQEEVFDLDFAVWLREELGMEETAAKLENMRKDHNNLKDIVVTLCCSCDYYTEEEIDELITIMDETQDLPQWGRRKIKADNYLRCGSLERARGEYEGVLKCDDMLHASQEDYGTVYHSLGVVCANLGEFKQAASHFQKAYEQNRKIESLEAYLYSLRLGGLEEEYEKAVTELELSREQQVFLHAQYAEAVRQSREKRSYRQIGRIVGLKEGGKKEEFRDRVDEMIAQWKQEYRQEIS